MRYVWVTIIALSLCSCAQKQLLNKEVSRTVIRDTINKQVNSYQREDRDNFFNSISKDYYPNYKELKFTIEDFLYANDNIQLDVYIEKILTSGQSCSVDINWYKTYINKQGTPIRQQGSAVLIFDVSGQKPILTNIKGDNLFTQ